MWKDLFRPSVISDRAHRLAEPVGRLVAKTGIHPNAVTITGFLLIIGVAWLLAEGWFLLGGILVLVISCSDFIDGALARATGKATTFGALLDSSLDRYSEAVLLFGLLWFHASAGAFTEVMLIFATLVGSLLVSYVRARAEGLGLFAEVGIMRRTLRVITLAVGLMLSPIQPALLVILWILAVATNLTALYRLFYVWRASRRTEVRLRQEGE
ncbi:MAG: CDP-alcohol phosphatidyltransferase family protein [Chloroflexota bacterium]|nr:CDP-alcohol phosphatidyltransferase family protein [Chloroflexota bacterium]